MDDQLEVEEDGTPLSIRDAGDDSFESYLIREPSLPVQYANCSGADVNIFASSEGISALRALHYCVGCAIRLEHLNIEVTKEYINGITLAVGGFNNRNAKIIAKLLKDNKLSGLPQLDTTPTQFHFEFMANLKAVKEFCYTHGRYPGLHDTYTLDAGTKIPMANASIYEIFEPLTFEVGDWYQALIRKDNPLNILFHFEIIDAGIKFKVKISQENEFKSAYALWRNRNPNATEFPLDTTITLDQSCYSFSGRRAAYPIDRPTVYDLGTYFANMLGVNPTQIASVPIVDLERTIDSSSIGYSRPFAIDIEQINDVNFELFISLYERWKENNLKLEYFSPFDSFILKRKEIGIETLNRLGIDSKSSTFKFEFGLFATKIRNGEFKLTNEQTIQLSNSGFIFDIEDFLLTRNIAILKSWVEQNPGKYLAFHTIKQGGAGGKTIILPSGSKIGSINGCTYVLRVDHRENTQGVFTRLKRSYIRGYLSQDAIKKLEPLGLIWDLDDFKEGIKATVGIFTERNNPDHSDKPGLSEERLAEIANFKRVELVNKPTSGEIIEVSVGTIVKTPNGEVYNLKHPVFVNMGKKSVHLDLESALSGLAVKSKKAVGSTPEKVGPSHGDHRQPKVGEQVIHVTTSLPSL